MSAAERILGRLQVVKPRGPNHWICSCPAHEDRSPSLSVTQTDDGRVLVHDFGGCSTEDVLGALGLALCDLFDAPLEHVSAPARMRIPSRDLLVLIDHELTVAMFIVTDVVEHKTISETDWQRLAQATYRVGRARDMCCPEEIKVK